MQPRTGFQVASVHSIFELPLISVFPSRPIDLRAHAQYRVDAVMSRLCPSVERLPIQENAPHGLASVRREAAEDSVGEIGVDLDELLAGDGVPLAARRAGLGEEGIEEVGQEVGEELGFLVGVGAGFSPAAHRWYGCFVCLLAQPGLSEESALCGVAGRFYYPRPSELVGRVP